MISWIWGLLGRGGLACTRGGCAPDCSSGAVPVRPSRSGSGRWAFIFPVLRYVVGPNMILVLDNYDSFTYNLVQFLGELGVELLVRRNDEISLEAIADLKPERILVSPGPWSPLRPRPPLRERGYRRRGPR